MNALLEQAQANTEELPEGGGEFETFLHPEGPTFARFVGYCEVGVRDQKPWKGQAKKPAPEVRFTFELNGPKSIRTITPEGEEPYQVPTLIRVKIAKKGGDRSSYTKLLRKMAYGRSITNFGLLLNEGFLITIVHGEGQDRDGNKKTYHNMRDADGNFTIGAPNMTDPLSGETKAFAIPEAVTTLSYFTWDNPTKEQWDSIYIDGERTVKDNEGNETVESKNWLQRDIATEAKNFQGSPLEALLNGMADLTMPTEDPNETGLSKDEETDMATAAVAALAAKAEASLAADAAALAALTAKAAEAETVNKPVDVEKPAVNEPVDEAAKALAAAQAIFDQLSGK